MNIKTVTVLGAGGVMGANICGIFASFGNAKVYMLGRDLQKMEIAKERAVKSVKADCIAQNLIVADYSRLAECVAESDLVFESLTENFEVKKDMFSAIAPHVRKDAVICTGTSGLSVTDFANIFPEELRSRFFGVHFFNPPYNMSLCELIAPDCADISLAAEMQEYLRNTLLRTVVKVKDSPAFLANRIGFQFINRAMQYAQKYCENGGIDYIDSILGSFTGRAMPPLLTADFVGLDVHKAIVDNIYKNTDDYSHETFVLPDFVTQLIASGSLGKKVGEGLYKTEIIDGQKVSKVYDISSGSYREKKVYDFPFAREMKLHLKNGDYSKAMNVLVTDSSLEATICLDFLLDYIIYSLAIAEKIGYEIAAADDVMATGFNWCPPLAFVEAISEVVDIKTLMCKKLSFTSALTQENVIRLIDLAVPSHYNYKPYFKAGR